MADLCANDIEPSVSIKAGNFSFVFQLQVSAKF
jgi:hypothetical protein